MASYLIQIDARDQSGLDAPLRLSSVGDPDVCHRWGEEWQPNISRLPTLGYDFFGGEFNGRIVAPTGQFTVSIAGLSNFGTSRFADSRVRIWQDYTLLFDGQVNGEPSVQKGVASFTIGADDSIYDEPLLNIYDGTGGENGASDITGAAKPRTLGNVQFANGILIDATNVVYQVNDGPIEAVNTVYDRGAALGGTEGDYETYADLISATVSPGAFATCLALGMVRLGAPADGRVSFDVSGDNVSGYVRKPGAIIARLAELAGGTVAGGNVAAVDVSRPYNLQLSVTDQTTARELIQQIADSVCVVAGISWTGKLFIQPLEIESNPNETLNSDGTSQIAVGEVSSLTIGPPFWRLATQAERTWAVHDLSEIASGYTLRGTHSETATYRLDDLVFATDGRSFVYVNTTSSSGNSLPIATGSDAYWQVFGTADRTASSQVSISAISPIKVTANSENVTTTDLTAATRTITLMRGGVDVSDQSTFAVGTAPGGMAASFTDNVFELSQADVGGSFPITVTYEGIIYDGYIVIERSKTDAPVTGGTGNTSTVSDATWLPVSSTTAAQITNIDMIIQSDASGELAFAGQAALEGQDGFQAGIQPKTSTDGVTWANVGSEVVSSAVQFYRVGAVPGWVQFSVTATGLTPSTDYYVSLFGRRVAGTGSCTFYDANFTVSQP